MRLEHLLRGRGRGVKILRSGDFSDRQINGFHAGESLCKWQRSLSKFIQLFSTGRFEVGEIYSFLALGSMGVTNLGGNMLFSVRVK